MALSNRVSRAIPQASVDATEAPNRGGRYGEQFIVPLYGRKHALADEGSYYIATNVVPTAIAMTASIQTFSDVAGAQGCVFLLENNDAVDASFPRRIYFDYIKLLTAVIPTGATSWQYAMVLDNNAARYNTGGSLIAPVPANGDVSTNSLSIVHFGAITTGVPLNGRLVARGSLRGVIPTVFDTLMIICGAAEGSGSMASAAASGRSVDLIPPIIIQPQGNLALFMWGASYTTAAQWEFEATWWER